MTATNLDNMPLIVVGADTAAGEAILEGLSPREREVRVFVSDGERGAEFKERGFKVAVGDVSDDSHVGAAATRCFSAVLIAEAADDDRERSFADDPSEVLRGWARAIEDSAVTRVIWVSAGEEPEVGVDEVAVVDPSDPGLAKTVVDLDEVSSLK